MKRFAMLQGRISSGLRHTLAWAYVFAITACTDPVDRLTQLKIAIDADSIVRMNAVRVEIRLQARNERGSNASKNTWDLLFDKAFEPDPAQDDAWPWRFTLDREQSSFDRYNLLAIARDSRGAVVGRVQAIRTRTDARRHDLRLHFDSPCFRPMKPCDNGYSCTAGVCVDATFIPNADRDGGVPTLDAGEDASPMQPNTMMGVASVGASCKDGTRACVEHGSRMPLRCENGSWVAQPQCAETERCSTEDGDDLGTCLPIASECMNRQPTVPYCDGETMKVCVDLVASKERACSENEWCATEAGGAMCRCRPGFVLMNMRCVPASDCGPANGGCDILTECSVENDAPVCSDCPAGYTGTGKDGCIPLLQAVKLDTGTLEPPFDPEVFEYRVRVPLLTPRIVLTPTPPSDATIRLNGAALAESGAWASSILPLGETPLELEVTSKFGVTKMYKFILERQGEQSGYLKTANAGTYDQFGSSVDISGDTLVATAWFEDSNATGVNGKATSMDATDSGAAFVYVRDGDGWKQQAYLKASDTRSYDYFGAAADLEGDTLVIGAIHEGLFESSTGSSRSGAVYVFERTDGTWEQTQHIVSKSERADMFGGSVVLDGDMLLVGAPWDASERDFGGAVYVYQRNGDMFTEVQKIVPSKPAANARFGATLALERDRLIVGAPDGPPPHNRPGSAEAFVRRNGSWSPVQVLQPSTLGGAANFGYSISMRGDLLAISAPRTSAYPGSPTPTDHGEVYVFEADGDTWKQTAQLSAANPRDTDWFGLHIYLTDAALVVGAPGDASGGRGLSADASRSDAPFSGAAYIYAQTDPGTWMPAGYIKAENAGVDDWFGRAVAVDGQTLVVSAMFENDGGASTTSGAVYVFR